MLRYKRGKNMNILDIVLICFVVLFALVGLCRGFFNGLFGLIGSLASTIASFFLAKPVASLLNNWFSITDKFGSSLSSQVTKYFSEFNNLSGAEIMTNHCSAEGFMKSALNLIVNPETIYESNVTLSSNIGNYVAGFATVALSFIISLILIKIVLLILGKIFDALKKSSGSFGAFDRILGLVFGIAQALVVVAVLFIVADLIQGIPAIATALDKIFDGSSIGKPLYDFITSLANNYLTDINFNALISSVIK